VDVATKTITVDGRSRHEIQLDIKRKEKAIEFLARKYAFGGEPRVKRKSNILSYIMYSFSGGADEEEGGSGSGSGSSSSSSSGAAAAAKRLTADDIRHCLYSIGDNKAFLNDNVVPVEAMLRELRSNFSPSGVAPGQHSLSIAAGQEGARLSHNHARQFAYVQQSLMLWHTILSDFYRFWCLAEEDFLDSAAHPYRLRDTGQGLNRVQQAPRIAAAMRKALHEAQSKSGGDWVGSCVVHLGDHNVPNAFSFLDKYTQVSRVLAPIVIVLEAIPTLLRTHPNLLTYVKEEFGSEEALRKLILSDFFRHAFDGSGADNFFGEASASCLPALPPPSMHGLPLPLILLCPALPSSRSLSLSPCAHLTSPTHRCWLLH
jgi:hypothetical protein